MTVSTEISSNEYTGNGVTTDFDYKFRIFKANQLSVITSDADGDNVVTLRLGTDYTVTGANKSAGGKVILTKPLANGHKVSIARDIPITQETSFRNQSKFFAETHEDAFDYLTMILQRIWGSLGSLYLKRPSILANWFDAKGYRIANLGKPKRDSDAVDLGTLKDEISGVNSTILKREKRLLRVDDMDISVLPKAGDRAGNVLTFDQGGRPIVVAPASGSAVDVINKIEENNGEGTLYSINRTKYWRIGNFKRGAVLENESDCLKYGNFYYAYRDSDALPITVEPNTAPNNDWVCVGDANMSYESHSIFNFGGKDDNGKTDNRRAIQLAIEYMEFSGSRLLTNSTKDSKYFGVSSFHPDYPNEFCIVIKSPRAVNIFGGRKRNASIRYTGSSNGKALFAIKPVESDWGMEIDSLGAHAGFKLDHVLFSEDFWLAQNMFSGGCYEGSLVSGIKIPVYMSTFSRVFSTYTGDYGFEFISPKARPTEPATSINVSNCWARDNKINGFRVDCQLWYSSWTNNGCDGVTNRAEYAYYFARAADGVTLESNGSESVKRYLYMSQPRSCRVAGIRCATMYPDAGSALITFNSAYDVKLENLGAYDNAKFQNEIEVLAASGNEHISVDVTFSPSKLKATKAANYYVFPNIFYFENNATAQTRGLTKLNNTIYASTKEISLSGTVNEVIEKQFIVKRGEKSVIHKLLKFYSTNNVDVIFSARMAGGGGVSYTSNSVVCSWALQSGQVFSHNTDNSLFRITNEGVELSITPKVNYTTIILTIQIFFKYDPSAGVTLYDSSLVLNE
ncbi:hypothetical protein [Providencia manganoxydans]|uniref:hypothetical protein n=1 Tax=Providencia manganoxydans TaxID=2923283 RepID=UPI0034E42F6C